MNTSDIPVPTRLAYRPKDRRGYPIPYIAYIDASGTPQFTINNHAKVLDVVKRRACALCGRGLEQFDASAGRPPTARHCWFVGGARCFLHPAGAFLDPPAHYDCAVYALKVCPYLAAPSYARRIGDKKLVAPHEDTAVVVQPMDDPSRPDVFGLGCIAGYDMHQSDTGAGIMVPHHGVLPGWISLEWWTKGRRLEQGEWEPDRERLSIRLTNRESAKGG
jgi:hypothetical protein